MNITDKARELAIAITGTREFSELKLAKDTVDRNRTLWNKLESFRKSEEVLYSGRLSAGEIQQKAAELKIVFDDLSSIPEVSRLLKAENDFNSMLEKVYQTIGNTLESSL